MIRYKKIRLVNIPKEWGLPSRIIFIDKGENFLRSSILKITSLTLFIVGLMLITYSIYHIISQKQQEAQALSEAKEKLTDEHLEEEIDNSEVIYSFSKGDVVGILDIPALNKELPIIEGTEEEELEKGIGHYSSTKLPNQRDRIFLAGHRDTVFKHIGELQEGDKLMMEMKNGTFTYEIFETFIVDETNISVLESTSPDEILTLSTCYPFEYLSSTEERYIINAQRIK
jgi:sortase A